MPGSTRKIIKEIRDLQKFPEEGVSFWPNDEIDVYNCTGVFVGPKNSPYENGLFFLNIKLDEEYPFKPPKVTFKTKIYNPCINSKGYINIDILSDQWSPALTVSKVLSSIVKLLTSFSADDPLVWEIAHEYKTNRVRYDCTAREWTKVFVM